MPELYQQFPLFVISKICNVCKVEKPFAEFGVRRASIDGLSYTCIVCTRARGKAHYQKNKDAYKKRARTWGQDNRSRRRAIVAKSSRLHFSQRSEGRKRRLRLYKVERPEYLRQMNRYSGQNRRARMVDAGHIPASWWRAMYDLFETNICLSCLRADKKLVMDHFIPISKGGKHEIGNVIPICDACNCRKHNHMPDRFYSPEVYQRIQFVLMIAREAFAEQAMD